MFLDGTSLTVPAGDAGAGMLTINFEALLKSEARQEEVAHVTPLKAPELLSEFNKSWRELHALVTRLAAEKLKAEKIVNKRRGVLLLEVVPSKVKEKGVKDSADIREAIIATDPEFETLQDRVDQLAAATEFLKGKMKSFENAYTSVKKIMGEDAYNMQLRSGNRDLKGDTQTTRSSPSSAPRPAAPAGPKELPPSMGRAGFGRPVYGR